MAFTLLELKNEIVNDPNSIGYKTDGVWKGDAVIADLINDTANGATITRKIIQRHEIISGIKASECLQLADETPPAGVFSRSELDYLCILLRDETIDANQPEIFAALLQIFPTEAQKPGFRGGSRTNIQNSLQTTGTRAEVLWGESTIITVSNVGHSANE